jgi:hypothetical protein
MAEFDEIPLILLGRNEAIYAERELPRRQYHYATTFAFERIRARGLVPATLIDLVEKFEERTRVKISCHRTQDGVQGSIQVIGSRIAPQTRVRSTLAALKRKSREAGLNWFTASEALALFLRALLRKHKTTTKPSPVRTQGVVSKRIISEAAMHLLTFVQFGTIPLDQCFASYCANFLMFRAQGVVRHAARIPDGELFTYLRRIRQSRATSWLYV